MSQQACASCGVLLTWGVTRSGKRIPLEPADDGTGNVLVSRQGVTWVAEVVPKGAGTHVAHFARCPNASLYRRRG